MKILSKEDLKTLPMNQKLELMDLFLLKGRGQEVEYEIKSRLKTFPRDKVASVAWEEAKRRLMP